MSLPNNWNIAIRPSTFDDICGNYSVKKYFKEKAKTGKWDNGYILQSPPGTGKTTFAIILAKYMSCKTPDKDGSPCNKCLDCKAIDNQNWTRDCILVDGNDKDVMGASAARDIIEKFTMFAATRGKSKVMIIDEAGKLSKEAISAFLKPLETPREGYHFIFTTMENLASDVSTNALKRRCKVWKLELPSTPDIYTYLASIAKKLNLVDESIPIEFWTKGLEYIAGGAGYSYGQAISLLEQCFDAKLYTVDAMRKSLSILDEENLNNAVNDLCKGDVRSDLVKSTFLSKTVDYLELYNIAYYRLTSAKLIKVFNTLGDEDWRESQSRTLSVQPHFEYILNCFRKTSEKSSGYLKKADYLLLFTDIAENLKVEQVRRRIVA